MRNGDYFGNATGPAALGSPGAGSTVMYPCEAFQTPQLDFTRPTTTSIELVPARPGHFPLILTSIFLIETATGTQTSPPTTRAGNNATHDNLIAQNSTNPSNAAFNTPSVAPCISGGGSVPAAATQRIPNAPVFFDVVTGSAGTGGYALKGKFVVFVLWTAIGGA